MAQFESFIGVNFWTALFTLLNFLAVFFVAKHFLIGPVMKIIKERQDEIDGMYSEANQAKASAEALQSEYEAKLSDAQATSERIVKEAVTRGQAREEEITEAYYDTAGRLETQKIKLERLQELLSKAELMEDIITIESAISETEWQIDNLSGTLRHYDSKVEYATVNINLREVYKLSNVEDVPETFGERISNSFSRGLSDFADTMENLAVGFAYSWMWWLLGAAVVAVLIRVVWGMKLRVPKVPRFLRRKKKDDNSGEN